MTLRCYNMNEKYPLYYRLIRAAAVAMIISALCFPEWMAKTQFHLAIGLIVLGGIPHGATDYLIFRGLTRRLPGTRTMTQFYRNYLLLMAAYTLLWLVSPIFALLLFLILSMFHFGQSNWNYLSNISPTASVFLNMIWGAFVLLIPIILHFDEAVPILTQILGRRPPELPTLVQIVVCLGILLLNIGMIGYLYKKRNIQLQQFKNEFFQIILLAALFYFLPLLIGFAAYFVFWHSLSSMLDQIHFFRQQDRQYDWRRYIRNALPFSLIAIGGLLLLIWGQARLGLNIGLGVLFMFISVITLPHMILIDRLYKELNIVEA